MSGRAANKKVPEEMPRVDVTRLEQLSQEVVASMQSLRELLSARATALEECRNAVLGRIQHKGLLERSDCRFLPVHGPQRGSKIGVVAGVARVLVDRGLVVLHRLLDLTQPVIRGAQQGVG